MADKPILAAIFVFPLPPTLIKVIASGQGADDPFVGKLIDAYKSKYDPWWRLRK